MTGHRYNWRRLWHQRGQSPPLWNDAYLTDSTALWSDGVEDRLAATEALSSIPCLILLGEPGRGKSTELHALCDLQTMRTGDQVLHFDLGQYSTDYLLSTEIFGHSTFQAWTSGSFRLNLFLD